MIQASRPRRRIVVSLALSAAVIMAFQPSSGVKAGPKQASPLGRVLVVTNNLQEAFSSADLRDMSEIKVWAKRLLGKVPYAPDVVLLQEVRTKSARFVARTLKNKTGFRYRVVISDKKAWNPPKRNAIVKATAIVINAKTMKVLNKGGFIRTIYKKKDRSGIKDPERRHHAYARVQERNGTLTMSLASVHYVTALFLKSKEIDRRYKNKWSRQIAAFLANKWPAASDQDTSIIAGDFNRARCDVPGHQCQPSAFWKTLTSAPYLYQDSVWTISKKPWKGGVDYIFANGKVFNSGGDWKYNSDTVANDKKKYYSDHKFRWAVVGAKTP